MTMKPTNGLRFVKRILKPNTIYAREAMILQQKWQEQVVVNVNGDPNNQITEWRYEWRDVPVEDE